MKTAWIEKPEQVDELAQYYLWRGLQKTPMEIALSTKGVIGEEVRLYTPRVLVTLTASNWSPNIMVARFTANEWLTLRGLTT